MTETTYEVDARTGQDLLRIADYQEACSYPMRVPAIAASDTCRAHATTGVREENGNVGWRCSAHQGVRNDNTEGEVVYEVPRSALVRIPGAPITEDSLCGCGEVTIGSSLLKDTVGGVVHRRGKPCFHEGYEAVNGEPVPEPEVARDTPPLVDVDTDPPIEPVRLVDYVWCFDVQGVHHVGAGCFARHRHLYVRVVEGEADEHVTPQPDPYEDEKRASLAACERDAERLVGQARAQGGPLGLQNLVAGLLQQIRRYDGLEARMRESYNHSHRIVEVRLEDVEAERNDYRERLREIRKAMRGLKMPRA